VIHQDVALPVTGAASARGLLSRLARESDATVAACEAAAKDRAQALHDDAERAAIARRREVLSARERQHAQELRAARELVQQRVVAETLKARAAVIEQVMATAVSQADELLPHVELADCLRADVAQAVRYLPDGAVNVRCRPSLAALAQNAAAAVDQSRISVVIDRTTPFGVVVESSDGRVTVDATIARRIAGDRQRLSVRVAQLLEQWLA